MAARHDQDRLADAVGEFLASEAAANPVPRGAPAPGDGAATRRPSAAPQRSLAEAFDEVIADEARRERERREIRESRWRQAGLWLVLTLLTGASGYVWFGKPAFLTLPIDPVGCGSSPAVPDQSRRAAHLRIWYLPPPRALAESAVDPAVRARLEALGYVQ